jgi:hypothetical protein
VDEDDDDDVTAASKILIEKWFRGCPCAFPFSLNSKRIYLARAYFDDPEYLAAALNGYFLYGAKLEKFVLVIFPEIKRVEMLVELIAVLAEHPRWECHQIQCGSTDLLSVELRWWATEEVCANVLGLGPFSWMPETRRAPLLCMGLWPREHGNPHITHDGGPVGLASTRFDKGLATHKALMKETVAQTSLISRAFELPHKDILRRISFRLPTLYADRLFPS